MTDVAATPPRGGITARIRRSAHTSALAYALPTEPLGWVRAHAEELRTDLREHGLLHLRGFPADIEVFDEVVTAVGGTMLEYNERSTPRHRVRGNIYTSTEYPPDQAIPLHNENSYSAQWPATLFFFCRTAPRTGGATPMADSRAVYGLIPESVRTRFSDGVAYTRTFREGLGLSWQEAFQTTDRVRVESYCARNGQEFTWDGDVLHTRHLRPAIQREPHTGADIWFNQAHLFHVSALEPEVREAVLTVYREDELPRNAYHAGGAAILDSDLDQIREAYAEASLSLPWAPGDIMIVNNMLMAHGREPYTGDRRIMVAMT
jgi:alpha-ketoglutarate-dependent taurine dioxygenase